MSPVPLELSRRSKVSRLGVVPIGWQNDLDPVGRIWVADDPRQVRRAFPIQPEGRLHSPSGIRGEFTAGGRTRRCHFPLTRWKLIRSAGW